MADDLATNCNQIDRPLLGFGAYQISMKLVVQQFSLQNPAWEGEGSPGKKLKAKIDAPGITNKQRIRFSVRDVVTDEILDTITGKRGETSIEWPVPNLPSTQNAYFRATLLDQPSTTNGQVAAILSADSGNQALNSFQVQITNIDDAFVPNQEKLEVAYTVTDAGGKAKRGRIEVWGERYPGAKPEPLFTKTIKPSAGNKTWKSWKGKANKGHLNNKFITPEFSPYRVRIIIGPTTADVEDPYGKGQGKVACAEAQFEVKFKSVYIQRWQNLAEATANDEYKLEKTLLIEPRNNDATGTYPAHSELPEERPDAQPNAISKTGIIRIPMAIHQRIADGLDQADITIASGYLEHGQSKWEIARTRYSRPELPIQFEPKLVSRDPGTNPEGLFEKDAVGPAIIEPVAEEYYIKALYEAGIVQHRNYWKNATFKVKKGTHDAPFHNANNLPEFHYWQARFEITADGRQDFDVSTFDDKLKYLFGQKELFVYLNRRLLSRSDLNDDTEIDKNKFDYREVDNGANSVSIKLRPNLTRDKDILWVVRKDSTASGANIVQDWEKFPPGPNCAVHYGGVRGKEPTAELSNYFRKDFSAQVGTQRRIIGKHNAAFPFSNYVELKPDKADQNKQERAEATAMTSGAEIGRAGVIFTPSIIAGDSYTLRAWIDREGYARRFGFIEERPAVKSESGRLTVWRWSRVGDSFRLPNTGTNGLFAGGAAAVPGGLPQLAVGGEPENGGRVYHGDGANMELQNGAIPANTAYGEKKAFNEWSLTAPPAGDGGDPIHRHVDLGAYMTAHNGATSAWAGHVNLTSNNQIKNYSAIWDAYRSALPPGLPANRRKLITNTIATLPAGTSTHDAGVAVASAISTRNATVGPTDDANYNPGVGVIPPFAQNDPDAYFNNMDNRWDGIMHAVLDALTPQNNEPQKVNVLRWPLLHERLAWKGYGGGSAKFAGTGGTLGFSRGSGQSMFATAKLNGAGARTPITNDNTFTHEMGHTMNLVHFRAGNFGWKHHDVNYPQCIMSYDYCGGVILREQVGAPVAVGGTQETGWPDVVPAGALDNYEGCDDAGGDAGKPCIHFPPIAEGNECCAKCLLKLRGWKDELLPFAWGHADLF